MLKFDILEKLQKRIIKRQKILIQEKGNNMNLNLIPLKKIGNIIFGESINKYKEKYDLEFIKDVDDLEIDSYRIRQPHVIINVNKSTHLIDSIMCYEELYYKGKNLIGLTIKEFVSFTKEKYYGDIDILDFEDDDIPQYVYEFEDIGLQVWEKGKGGKIVTIIAGSKYPDD